MIPETFLLLIEDNDDDAFLFQRAVERVGEGLRAHRVSNGQEGIDYLQGNGSFSDRNQFPLPHLLLVDLKMPLCDGFQFLEWKRGQQWLAPLPAIVMTSSALDSDIRRSFELGAHSFTCKEGDAEQLRERITGIREWWLHHCLHVRPQPEL